MNPEFDQAHGKNRHVNTEWRPRWPTIEPYSTPVLRGVLRIAGVRDPNQNCLRTRRAIVARPPVTGQCLSNIIQINSSRASLCLKITKIIKKISRFHIIKNCSTDVFLKFELLKSL